MAFSCCFLYGFPLLCVELNVRDKDSILSWAFPVCLPKGFIMRNTLDLGLIGNCHIGALIDEAGEIVWCCLPRFDADPVFCSLLREHDTGEGFGYSAIELADQAGADQYYLANSAVLVTRLTAVSYT